MTPIRHVSSPKGHGLVKRRDSDVVCVPTLQLFDHFSLFHQVALLAALVLGKNVLGRKVKEKKKNITDMKKYHEK